MAVGGSLAGAPETVFPQFFFTGEEMTKTAILIDGGWMAPAVSYELKVKFATAKQVYDNARSVMTADEELYRMFYYDSEPYKGHQKNPISNVDTDFSLKPAVSGRERFYRELNAMSQVALRIGSLNYRGWKLTDEFYGNLINGTVSPNSISESDIKPNFTQKGVDMKIGIDIASLVFKKLVSRIILFSGDTDMVPAMKLARVEGIQIVMIQIGKKALSSKLIEDSDFVRTLNPKK